jgi:hypothetical protein
LPPQKILVEIDQVGALPADPADDLLPMMVLGLPTGVGLGVVEEVDAGVEGGRSCTSAAASTFDLRAERDPGAEGQCRDVEAAVAEKTVFHGGPPSSRV